MRIGSTESARLADDDIFMLVHGIGYFSHINRVADGLGIDLEPGMGPSPYLE